jgi:Mg-chelatase subunit ChlI
MIIMERNLGFEQDSTSFAEEWQPMEYDLADRIAEARCLLPEVRYSRADMATIAEMMAELGVDGHRGDLVILKTAIAHAAWERRQHLTDRDIILAAELALPHRLKRRPFDEVQTSIDQLDKMVASARDRAEESTPEREQTFFDGDPPEGALEKKV